MSDKYILEGHKAVVCNDLMKWAKWFETANRRVKETFIGIPAWKFWLGKLLKIKKWEPVKISTIFLGLNHNYDIGSPVLFETMIFGGDFNGDTWRYTTWEQAGEGHRKAVEKVKARLETVE